MRHATRLAALLALGLISQAPHLYANSLVFCSEGSPAGFDPGQYTTGTDFDAAAETMFNRLPQFERGGTEGLESPQIFQTPEVKAAGGLIALQAACLPNGTAGTPFELLRETKTRMFAA